MSARVRILKRLDALAGPPLCALFSRPQREPERRTLRDFPGGRVLFLRPGGIGDAVLLLPALSALRRALPGHPVDVLCEGRNAALFEASGLVDRVLRYDARPLSVLFALRRARYAAALDAEQFHRFSAVLAALTRAPLRIGFNASPVRLGLYTHTVPYDQQDPEDALFGRLVAAALGGPVELPPRLGILPSSLLPPPPTELPARFVALHVGGSAPCKRWPAERFAALARALRERLALPSVLLGSAADRADVAAVAAASGAIDLGGRLSLAQVASVCARAALVVGPDSGVAHLSVAAGTPAVVLFGPSDPLKWGPPSDVGEALRHPLPCSPCSMFGYTKPCRRFACMEALSVEEVFAAVERRLREEIK